MEVPVDERMIFILNVLLFLFFPETVSCSCLDLMFEKQKKAPPPPPTTTTTEQQPKQKVE
jgi:hypothetical protein